jgi:hypothetical protein
MVRGLSAEERGETMGRGSEVRVFDSVTRLPGKGLNFFR